MFIDRHKLDKQQIINVNNSIECLNEDPIVGDNLDITSQEVKQRAYGSFYSQNRAVTLQDYKSMAYSMPEQFGSIARCIVVQDSDSFRRNLNLYILAKDRNGNLSQPNDILKQNLKFWLNKYRMINDAVDILDGRIINLGIKFQVLTENNVNKYSVLQRCQNALSDLFSVKPDLGEPLNITSIYKTLNSVVGVADTLKVKISQKVGAAYSDTSFSIDQFYSADRRYIMIPRDAAYEFKFPNSDFEGTCK